MRQPTSLKPFQILRPFVLAIAVIMSGPSLGIAAGLSDVEADYVQSQRCSGALSIMTALGLEDETLPIYKYFSDLLDFQSFILEYPFSDWTPMIPITESAYALWLKSGLRDIHRCKSTGLNRTIECYTKEKE